MSRAGILGTLAGARVRVLFGQEGRQALIERGRRPPAHGALPSGSDRLRPGDRTVLAGGSARLIGSVAASCEWGTVRENLPRLRRELLWPGTVSELGSA